MSKIRLGLVFSFFLIFGAMIVVRLFSIQIEEGKAYQERSQRQQELTEYEAKRGDVYVQDKEGTLLLLATTKSFLRLYAVPSRIEEGKEEAMVKELSQALGLPETILRERLSKKDDPYEPLQERIPLEERGRYESLTKAFPKLLELQEYKDRFYPYENLASHVVGFLGFQGNQRKGLYGIEKFYDEELAKGADILLTLDISVQRYTEDLLSDLLEKWKSPAGSIVIMRPSDGAILAMTSRPDFNPNAYQEVKDISHFLNPITQKVFEPGSIVKPVTMAAGLEAGKVTPESVYEDKGFVERGGHIIRNAGRRTYGRQTMKQVLEFSINTGAIFVQEQVGQKDFLRTFEKFGFGKVTGIDLPGELGGDITNLDTGRPINYATASFGQGVSATPLQIIAALGSIANEGRLVRPRVGQKLIYPESTRELLPEIKGTTMEPQNAANLVAMLTEVVNNGYDKKARVPGYSVAGKTGTSQIPDPKGGYLETTIHSFVGFAPAFDPAFIVLIKMDEPIGIRFASESIAPAFSQLTQHLLQYYEVVPDKVAP